MIRSIRRPGEDIAANRTSSTLLMTPIFSANLRLVTADRDFWGNQAIVRLTANFPRKLLQPKTAG